MKLETGQEVYHKETLKTGVVLQRKQATKNNLIVQAFSKFAEVELTTKVLWDNGDIECVNTKELAILELQLL